LRAVGDPRQFAHRAAILRQGLGAQGLGEFCQGGSVDGRAMGNPRRARSFPADDGDRRIGDHLGVEGRRVHHVDVYFQMELLGDQAA